MVRIANWTTAPTVFGIKKMCCNDFSFFFSLVCIADSTCEFYGGEKKALFLFLNAVFSLSANESSERVKPFFFIRPQRIYKKKTYR